jgi:hypothetical protein
MVIIVHCRVKRTRTVAFQHVPSPGKRPRESLQWRTREFQANTAALQSIKSEEQQLPFQTNPISIDATTPAPQSATTAGSLTNGLITSTTDRSIELYTSLLAASYRNSNDDLDIPCTTPEYLRIELNVERLNLIHKWLWAVGRPMPPRALHHQTVLGREIVLTERMDMHLVWSGSRMFLKPIPRFLLEPRFWTDHLKCDGQCYVGHSLKHPFEESRFCEKQKLRRCALGFLLSYAALISYESDFRIAHDTYLLPKDVKWSAWKVFVKELLAVKSIYTHVNKRFIYGELRLNRLNLICRLGKGPIRGYQPEYSQYASFFRAHFTWLASLLAYIVIILSAMQVGLGVTVLQENESFQAASYGFTVFSILAPLAAIAIIFTIFLIVFVGNWIHTSKYEKRRLDQLGKAALTA